LPAITVEPSKDVLVRQQIGFVGDDLLHPQRPLLVPRPRQPQRLVPGGKLDGPGAGRLRQHHRQHLDQDAVDVVLRLLLGEPQRIDLDAVAEAPEAFVRHAIALAANAVPQLGEGAHLGDLGDELEAGIDEEADAPDRLLEGAVRQCVRRFHRIEHRHGGGERERHLLHRRRAGLLQVVGAHVDRVPLGHLAAAPHDGVAGEPERGLRREHVGAARQIFLDDVVLDGARQRGARRALFVGHRGIERQQPGGRGVDGHGRVHLLQRQGLEQLAHVADVGDRHAELADLAAGQRMVGSRPVWVGRSKATDSPVCPLARLLRYSRLLASAVEWPA
jgi:hypothetical protein